MLDDLTGRTFGRLVVLERRGSNKSGKKPKWLCRCICGNEKVILGHSLKQKLTQSCGCLNRDYHTKHGIYTSSVDLSYHIKFVLLKALQNRARRNGYESDLEISDMPEIPTVCPVLGTPLFLRRSIYETRKAYKNLGKGRGYGRRDSSPTVDRFNTNLPYLKKYKSNLSIISWRANRIKCDATPEELIKIADYVKSRVALIERESSLIDSNPISSLEGNEGQAVNPQAERLSEKTPEVAMQ